MCEYYDDELMHYGVKGMKWGHHKFHNADGSLNSIGKQKLAEKFNKVSKSKIRTYRNKAIAINSYKVSKKYSDGKKRIYTRINKRVNKKLDRFNKKVAKKNEKGKYKNLSQVIKDSNRGNELIRASKQTEQLAKEWLKESKQMEKKISDIKNEKIKAGKDYIAEHKLNLLLGYNEFNVYDRYGNNVNSSRVYTSVYSL